MSTKTPDKNKTRNEVLGKLGKTTSVVFSFDTTGSMQPCIAQVRKQLRDLAELMFTEIPNLKMGLIAHGDYCDGANCMSVLDLTSNLDEIMKFINDTPNTSGGDAPECYELVLHKAQSLNWPEEGGALVLIGDATPHPKEQNPDKLDWKDELRALMAKKVNVFPMQCLKNEYSKENNNFWEAVSQIADTPLIILDSFNDSADTLAAVAYATAGADHVKKYAAKTRARAGGATANLSTNLEKLTDFADSKDS